MHKKIFFLLVFVVISIVHGQQQTDDTAHFTLKPTLTPDAKAVIFSYEGDLWKVSSDGGEAYRITAMQGVETNPSVSPDGKWLAFSSYQYGNNDVYIMPLKGGKITQLTFHQADDMMSSWSWDSTTINFTSNRYNLETNYTIAINGGTPKRTFGHYFNRVHNVVQHPKTNDIYFNESSEASFDANRKRYKGDYNPDIKSYNQQTKKYTQHTTYRGKDFATTIDAAGNIYFQSDSGNGEYNLYKLENGTSTQLTNFSTSIMWPKVSANGEKIVFRKDYQLFVYDVANKTTKKLKINISNNSTLEKEESYTVKGAITFFDVSSDGKKMAFVARGKLFVSDVKGKFVKEIPTNSLEAVKEVKWLKDNNSLLFSQSDKGYYNWFVTSVTSKFETKQLTKNTQNNRQITFNADKTKGVYLRGRNDIYILDLETFKSELIVTDELWGFYNSNPQFSPDGKYISYTAYRDFEADIFVYNIASKKSINLTKTKVSEREPIWSADGKYIYLSSERTAPSFPSGGSGNSKVYKMALDKYEKPFKIDKINALFKEEKKKEKDEKDGKDKKTTKKKEEVIVAINEKGLMDRLTLVSPQFGNQHSITVVNDGEKTHVLYVSNHDQGKRKLWKTTLAPFENNKTVKLSDKTINGYQFNSVGKKHFILSGGNISTVDLKANKLQPVTIDYRFHKSLSNEFDQMYYEAWAGMEENYYDENFHGENWQKLRDQYATYLPYVSSRANLRLIFNDMLGELNTSHSGFRSSGKEEETYHGTRTSETGIIFNTENPFVVERIVTEGPTDIKNKDLKKGDKLVAVNGKRINEKSNREQYFANPKFNEELQLTFSRNNKEFKVNIHAISFWGLKDLLIDEWQDQNQAHVDKKSNNKIAYVCMKDMGRRELTKFYQDLISDEAYKEGLILDLRWNTGGNVHDAVLNFLRQKQYLNWKYREGKLTSQSNFNYGDKPIVLLINEQSLSDAEMTAAGFKELKIGTIVGTETYRWIIFTTSKSLVDGSSYRLPTWGCYTLDGKDLEMSGVAPDVYVGENFKQRLENEMPQLDKAIEIILKELNKK
ncbi:S41 family peptidase [Kordia jejudonensis]|uniref:S41 family peptidase n=1 Tax=Kordia jejudonensis TaxID=1348245 RepID=UPI000629255C|nr:S41 family peptidase [Kordia jejudonensis]